MAWQSTPKDGEGKAGQPRKILEQKGRNSRTAAGTVQEVTAARDAKPARGASAPEEVPPKISSPRPSSTDVHYMGTCNISRNLVVRWHAWWLAA
jgi:hypothetical protein